MLKIVSVGSQCHNIKYYYCLIHVQKLMSCSLADVGKVAAAIIPSLYMFVMIIIH